MRCVAFTFVQDLLSRSHIISVTCLSKGIRSYLKDISSDKISTIFGRTRQGSEIDDLHAAMIRGVINFATTVPAWGSTFVDDDTQPSYKQIFPQELAQTTQSYFNQLLLAVEAACFFRHASSRLSARQGFESLRQAIYNSSFQLMVRWLMQTVMTVLGEDNNTVTDNFISRVRFRNANWNMEDQQRSWATDGTTKKARYGQRRV